MSTEDIKIEITHHLVYKATLSGANYKDMTAADIMAYELAKDADAVFCDAFEDEDNVKATKTTIKITDASGDVIDVQDIDHEE